MAAGLWRWGWGDFVRNTTLFFLQNFMQKRWHLSSANSAKFLDALVIGAWFRCRSNWRACWAQAVGVLRALFSKSVAVSDEMAAQRLAVCERCPVYCKTLETCGSPAADDPTLGCWCYMPVKASTSCNCWLVDEALPGGWPSELNTKPIRAKVDA